MALGLYTRLTDSQALAPKPAPILHPDEVPPTINRGMQSAARTSKLYAELRAQIFVGAAFEPLATDKINATRAIVALMETKTGNEEASAVFTAHYPLQDLRNAGHPQIEMIEESLYRFHAAASQPAALRRPVAVAAPAKTVAAKPGASFFSLMNSSAAS